MGALRWPALPLRGLCASKHISFSFVSILFLVRGWDSWQWERPALLHMQDLRSHDGLCTLRSSGFGDAAGGPSQLGSSWVCCREHCHLRTSPRLSPETAPSCCLTTLLPPNIIFLGLFPAPHPEFAWATTSLHIAKQVDVRVVNPLQRRGAEGPTGRGHEGASWGAGNVLYLGLTDGYMRVCVCKRLPSRAFKIVHCGACKLYPEREREREEPESAFDST